MNPSPKIRLLLTFFLLGAVSVKVRAQDKTAAAPSPEGTLNTYLTREPTDVAGKVGLLSQTDTIMSANLTVLMFEYQYGSRVHLERIYFPATTADHEMIPGYVFTPATSQPGIKRPGLVIVHGAFHQNLEWTFFRLIVEAVDHGYAVIFPEYRGSTGYGETIYQNNYGVTDVADVLASADYLAQQDFVDGSRMGILGHSRGGMATLLALERAPQRFQAAVDLCGLADFLAYMSYKPEARREEVAQEQQFGGKLPFENLPAYLAVSPIEHVDAIQTPLLFLGTTGDKIVPLSLHGARLIDAMKARGKVFESHIYTDAPGGHIFIFGDSKEQRDCFRRSFAWLGKFLKP